MPSTTATDDPLEGHRSGTVLVLSGDVTDHGLDRLAPLLRACTDTPVDTLDLAGADFPDGPALARMVDVVREISSNSGHLWVVGAPQAFAHVLYRTGDLGRIELVDVRFDVGAAW